MSNIIIQKFGGTSVQDADAMRRVIAIVRTYGMKRGSRPLVVLSACAGVTNSLIRIGELALVGKIDEAHKEITALDERHYKILHDFHLPPRYEQEASIALRTIWRELRTVIRGIELLDELTPKMKDKIVSCGERASTTIFYQALRKELSSQKVLFLDARDFFTTDSQFGFARPKTKEIAKNMKSIAKRLMAGALGVTQGFVGATDRGETTTIGRGGSDFSASIMGVAVEAKEIQIWTDVAGIYTCDPRIVPTAYAQTSVSFKEASVMAYYGAKVLHPETIWPAVEADIPVKVLSSKEPELPGTTIVLSEVGTPELTGIAIIKTAVSFKLRSRHSIPQSLIAAKLFDALDKKKIVPLAVSQSFDNITLVLDETHKIADLQSYIEQYCTIDYVPKRSLITLVGHSLYTNAGIAARMFRALKNTNCDLISYGGLDNSISVIISRNDTEKAAKAIHKEFFA